ncbi:hypothetical protein DZF79_02725 [Vibrio parahaemolyticus]|nr:hypothetical protein [Vibrio parahaemolyticus]
MATQIDLLGRAGGFNYLGVEEHWFCSVQEGLEVIESLSVGIAAANRRSIIIWVDDEGQYHGLYKLGQKEASRLSFATKEKFQGWLENHLPHLFIELKDQDKPEEDKESHPAHFSIGSEELEDIPAEKPKDRQ